MEDARKVAFGGGERRKVRAKENGERRESLGGGWDMNLGGVEGESGKRGEEGGMRVWTEGRGGGKESLEREGEGEGGVLTAALYVSRI
jgi:hypothetical protein